MDQDHWGLTDKGFYRPSYQELLDALEIEAITKFGGNINLTSRSILGLFLRLFAWIFSKLWQVSEDVYNSAFIDSAVGVSLIRLGALIGIDLLPAQKAVGRITITGEPGASVFMGLIVASRNNQRFVTVEDALIGEDGTVTTPIRAYVAGPDGNVAAGTITQIVTPQAAIISVINPEDVIGGRLRETEAEFRARYRRSTDIAGGSNADAIRAELLRTEAVAAATVLENDTDEIDEQGLPPHSIECIVYGGADVNVAATIHRRKAAGIQTHGNYVAEIVDKSGRLRAIRFSRPSPRPVWIRVTNLTVGDNFPLKGKEMIRDNLIAYVGDEAASSALTGGLSIGETLVYNRLICPVNDVPGVIDFTLEISADGETWGKENIPANFREKIVAGIGKVVIA